MFFQGIRMETKFFQNEKLFITLYFFHSAQNLISNSSSLIPSPGLVLRNSRIKNYLPWYEKRKFLSRARWIGSLKKSRRRDKEVRSAEITRELPGDRKQTQIRYGIKKFISFSFLLFIFRFFFHIIWLIKEFIILWLFASRERQTASRWKRRKRTLCTFKLF